jgi:hypothetical protein
MLRIKFIDEMKIGKTVHFLSSIRWQKRIQNNRIPEFYGYSG